MAEVDRKRKRAGVITKKKLNSASFCTSILNQLRADMLTKKGIRHPISGKLWTQYDTKMMFTNNNDVTIEYEIPDHEGGDTLCGYFRLVGCDERLERYQFHLALHMCTPEIESVTYATICVRGEAEFFNDDWLNFHVVEYRVDISSDDVYRRLFGSRTLVYPGGYDLVGLRFPMSGAYYKYTKDQPDVIAHFDVEIVE